MLTHSFVCSFIHSLLLGDAENAGVKNERAKTQEKSTRVKITRVEIMGGVCKGGKRRQWKTWEETAASMENQFFG